MSVLASQTVCRDLFQEKGSIATMAARNQTVGGSAVVETTTQLNTTLESLTIIARRARGVQRCPARNL